MTGVGSCVSFKLTLLPDKAVTCLLSHLNVWNLMNLRHVCKKTKAWVEEDPDVLKRFVLQVKERRLLRELLRSKIKWSNLMISCDVNDVTNSWIRSEEYLNAFMYLQNSIKVLKFDEQRLPFNSGLDWILSQCSRLEELQVGTLNLANARLPMSNEIVARIAKLTSLKINFVAWEIESDLSFFPQALEKCVNLKYLKLPYILSATLYSIYPDLDEDEVDLKLANIVDEVLFKPVRNFLLKENDCVLKYIDVENFEVEQILEGLAPACSKSGTLFLNVLEAFERPFTKKESELCNTIASLLNCSKNLDLNRLTSLEAISILDDCTASTDIDKKFEKAALPSLKYVTLTLTKSILVSERLASCFLQQKRESVESVDVKFEDLKGSAQASVFRTPKFAMSLPNLRSLSFNEFDGKPEDYLLLWNNFPLLESLKLFNCRTLKDLSLTGVDQDTPSFLNLKFLQRLTIEYGDVSDAALELVISKLSLESLVLALPKVTKKGLEYLEKSRMTSSLMVFHCMKPEDCSEDEMKTFFRHFKNLKKYEMLF